MSPPASIGALKNVSERSRSVVHSQSTSSAQHAVLDGVDVAPTNIFEALHALETVAPRLHEQGDARAVFPEVYAVITRRVKEAVEGRGPAFLEPQWISRLAGFFCEYYLKALKASFDGRPTGSDAWDIAFEHADAGEAPPSICAMLGINAHINYDLAQGVYDDIILHEAANDTRLLRRYRHDHDLVNSILADAMPEIFQILASKYDCPLAAVATVTKGVQEAVSKAILFTLRQWRDRVWGDLLTLLALSNRAKKGAVLARMNSRSGFVARACITGNGAFMVGYPRIAGAVWAMPFAA